MHPVVLASRRCLPVASSHVFAQSTEDFRDYWLSLFFSFSTASIAPSISFLCMFAMVA